MEYLSIADFAEKAGVSKQAVYKQVHNGNSQLSPYVVREGKKILIKVSALMELYGVEIKNSTETTENTTNSTMIKPIEVENTTLESTTDNPKKQPIQPESTPEFQPISTDYIAFLKAQVSELKAEKQAVESRLNATIAEKDSIIKDQSEQLAQLAKQVAQIADKALIATAQQQYLTAMATGEGKEQAPIEEAVAPTVEPQPDKPKKSFWDRLFSKE